LRPLLIAEFVRFWVQWENVRRMGKTQGWQKSWLQKYPLGPYAFQNRIEKRLRRQVKLANFSFEMKEQLIRIEQPLPETTITWLYEACLRASSEKATVEVAQRAFGNQAWKRGEHERDKLRTLLEVFAEYDADSKLRKALGVRKDFSMKRKATILVHKLSEFEEQFRLWKPYAAWNAWQKDYREFVCLLDERLRKRHPHALKQKIRRAEVIRFAIDTIGLKATAEDNISRMLSRYKKKP
jgi:hypothetical protein